MNIKNVIVGLRYKTVYAPLTSREKLTKVVFR